MIVYLPHFNLHGEPGWMAARVRFVNRAEAEWFDESFTAMVGSPGVAFATAKRLGQGKQWWIHHHALHYHKFLATCMSMDAVVEEEREPVKRVYLDGHDVVETYEPDLGQTAAGGARPIPFRYPVHTTLVFDKAGSIMVTEYNKDLLKEVQRGGLKWKG